MYKYFSILLLLILVNACVEPDSSNNNKPENVGLSIYTKNCVMCHGNDGKLNAMKAKDLSISVLSSELTKQAIEKGSPEKGMPAYGPRLSAEELNTLTEYVLQLRK